MPPSVTARSSQKTAIYSTGGFHHHGWAEALCAARKHAGWNQAIGGNWEPTMIKIGIPSGVITIGCCSKVTRKHKGLFFSTFNFQSVDIYSIHVYAIILTLKLYSLQVKISFLVKLNLFSFELWQQQFQKLKLLASLSFMFKLARKTYLHSWKEG